MAHSAEITEIESISAYVTEGLKRGLYRDGLVTAR